MDDKQKNALIAQLWQQNDRLQAAREMILIDEYQLAAKLLHEVAAELSQVKLKLNLA